MVEKNTKTHAIVNNLGTLGYLACALQWCWLGIIMVPAVAKSPFWNWMYEHPQQTPPPTITQTPSPGDVVSPLIITIGFLVGVAIIAAWLYILVVKLPKTISKTGEMITHIPAKAVLPVFEQHAHVTPKQKRQFSTNALVTMKLLLIFLPLGLLLFAQSLSLPVAFEFIMSSGVILFGSAFGLFAFQFVLAHFLHIDYRTLR